MTAKIDGESYFKIDDNKDDSLEQLQFLVQTALKNVLNLTNKLLVVLVRLKADQKLTLFQTLIGELFKQAAYSRQHDQEMPEITKEVVN